MICVEGGGAISHVSVRNRPDLFHEPLIFAALHLNGPRHRSAAVVEGPVPNWKVFFPWKRTSGDAGLGASDKTYGFPRYRHAQFSGRFPFCHVWLEDEALPVAVAITGWSPFVPGRSDVSSLPVCALEYQLTNATSTPVEAIYSFHAKNFMAKGPVGAAVRKVPDGFILSQAGTDEHPHWQGDFFVACDSDPLYVNASWFRGSWYDSNTVLWRSIENGSVVDGEEVLEGEPSPGGSLYAPISLRPQEQRTVTVLLGWHVPLSDLRITPDTADDSPSVFARCITTSDFSKETYRPWYASRFKDVHVLLDYWRNNWRELRYATSLFTDTLFSSSLPVEVMEAVSANLSILKSPTILRQYDGRLWAWEGCGDERGSCYGSCTHVWNYAQAIPHLFPDLERSLRETEFYVNQDSRGHQAFRSSLPIGPPSHDFYAAADGQLGGVLNLYRDWRIHGDTEWLKRLFGKLRKSLDYCIQRWDPDREGVLREPHHTTFDIEFWGPDARCSSIYVAALAAASTMGNAIGEDVSRYAELYRRGRAYLEEHLFNGNYFFQEIQADGLRAGDPVEESTHSLRSNYSAEALELLRKEGPKYQYGNGCLSDGILGAWLAFVCGLGEVLDENKVAAHLVSVFKHNFKTDLSWHANPQRSTFALGQEAGLVLCTWPRGRELTLPFVYSDEVWSGIEYQLAAHLFHQGYVSEGLAVVQATRERYDGRVRNPFNEYECGSWYARALSSYSLLQGLTGVRYDAVDKVLYIAPSIAGDFQCFVSTATGYGLAGVHRGEPFLRVVHGSITYDEIKYQPYSE